MEDREERGREGRREEKREWRGGKGCGEEWLNGSPLGVRSNILPLYHTENIKRFFYTSWAVSKRFYPVFIFYHFIFFIATQLDQTVLVILILSCWNQEHCSGKCVVTERKKIKMRVVGRSEKSGEEWMECESRKAIRRIHRLWQWRRHCLRNLWLKCYCLCHLLK